MKTVRTHGIEAHGVMLITPENHRYHMEAACIEGFGKLPIVMWTEGAKMVGFRVAGEHDGLRDNAKGGRLDISNLQRVYCSLADYASEPLNKSVREWIADGMPLIEKGFGGICSYKVKNGSFFTTKSMEYGEMAVCNAIRDMSQ